MPRDATHKSRGGKKDSADKNTFNPPQHRGPIPESQTPGMKEQDPKRRIGQFSGKGEPPLQKR